MRCISPKFFDKQTKEMRNKFVSIVLLDYSSSWGLIVNSQPRSTDMSDIDRFDDWGYWKKQWLRVVRKCFPYWAGLSFALFAVWIFEETLSFFTKSAAAEKVAPITGFVALGIIVGIPVLTIALYYLSAAGDRNRHLTT